MIRSEARIPGISWVLAFMAATIMALAWAPTVMAQQDDQYGGTVAPTGPAAGVQCAVPDDTDGVVNSGDTIVIAGDFVVTEGASVTCEDSDGTQGTQIDGQNAEISEGSIIIEVTGEPVGVVGGNGVLNTDGLFLVATTGIFAADGDEAVADDDGAAVDDDGAAADDGGTEAVASTGDGTSAQASTGGGAAEDAAGSGSSEDGAAVAVLPDTGGSILAFVLAGGMLLIGSGFVIRRLAGSN